MVLHSRFVGILLVYVLSACTSLAVVPPLSAKAISAPTQGDISMPEEPHYFGPENAAAGVFGLLGAIAVSGETTRTKDRIKEYMDKNAIDVRQIVASQFRDQLAKTDYDVCLPDTAASPPKFRLSIRSYGISHKMLFSKEYKPWLKVHLELLGNENSAVWDATSFINRFTDETPSSEFESYFNNPAVLSKALDSAAAVAVRELLSAFAADHANSHSTDSSANAVERR